MDSQFYCFGWTPTTAKCAQPSQGNRFQPFGKVQTMPSRYVDGIGRLGWYKLIFI
jgi:hypothetical protein